MKPSITVTEPKKEERVFKSDGLKGQELLGITDPMYDTIIDDLISAGKILLNCKHESVTRGPCRLCSAVWEGCVMNANAIREGKALLKKGKK